MNGNGVKHYAKISRQVVLHRIASASCLGDRLYWAIILWSWCGPERTEDGRVVRKDEKGYICTDHQGREKPARAVDLREFLGLPEGMKGHVSRELERLTAQNLISFEGGIMYANGSPTIPETPEKVASTGNFSIVSRYIYIGSRHISTGNLPTDPAARERAVQWLEETRTSFNTELKALRTRYHELLVQAAPDLGIIIDIEEKKRRGEASSSSSFEEPEQPENATTTTTAGFDLPDPTPEPEPTPTPEPEPTPETEIPKIPQTNAAEFHIRMKALFQGAGKPVPIWSQSHEVWTGLNGDAELFLLWLEAEKKLRRIQHPGVLPSLMAEFEEWKSTQPPPKPKLQVLAAICPRCRGTGFLDGFEWSLLPDAERHATTGAEICDCREGEVIRQLVEVG